MPTDKETALAELHAYRTEDEVLLEILRASWEIIEQSDIAAGLDFEMAIYNLAQASPTLQHSHYATSSCKALLAERLIVVNERFLIEIEAAVRAFETSGPLEACPYLRSDEDLFGLTDRIGADPYKYVARMRKLTSRTSEKERAMRQTVFLTYLFFIGREIGHLSIGNEARNFAQFVDADSPLEHRLANAVVKLRRHAEEFKEFGFDLPGSERTLKQGDEIEVSSAALRNRIARLHLNHTRWFQEEVDADEIGTRVVLEHLSALSGGAAANTCMYRMVRGVFAAALYSWYRDLRTFCRALGTGWLSNAKDLALAMTRDRKQYIHAASLFGNVHRFTLLRSERLIEAVIKARSNVFDRGQGPARLHGNNGDENATILREAVARYYLLCIMMDTAVKIAYIGASTAWILRMDQKRGTPQVLMVTFESVAAAMERLKKMID